MNFAPCRHSGIALDIGAASVAACQIDRSGDRITLRSWGLAEDALRERPGDEAVRSGGLTPTSLDRAARLVEQLGFRGRDVIICMKPPDVSFIPVAAPEAVLSAPRDELRTALSFQAARELQCDPQSLVVDGWPLPKNRTGANYLVAAAPREAVLRRVEALESIGLTVRHIEALPSAILRAAWRRRQYDEQSLWGALDIGFGGSVLALAKGPHCVYVRKLTGGGDALTLAILDALEVNYSTAELLKRQQGAAGAPADGELPEAISGVLRTHMRSLAREIEKAFSYAMESYPELTPKALHLCGGGAKLDGITAALHEHLGIEVSTLDACTEFRPHDGTARPSESEQPVLAPGIGMALGDVL